MESMLCWPTAVGHEALPWRMVDTARVLHLEKKVDFFPSPSGHHLDIASWLG